MATTILTMRVPEYEAWRRGYENGAETRAAAGVTSSRVMRSVDDANTVVVVTEYRDLAAARAFLASPQLKAAMERSRTEVVHAVFAEAAPAV